MKSSQLTFDDLKAELRELGERFPSFGDDDLFVLWFLRAYVTDSLDRAAEAITGGSFDKGVDGILIDDAAHAISIVQGKYRQKLEGKTEGRSDLLAFAELAAVLCGWEDDEFHEYLSGVDEGLAERLRTARKKARKDKYRTQLYFVTTGKVSATVRDDVQQQVRNAGKHVGIEIIEGKRMMLLFGDYLDDLAPPIPSLELEMEKSPGVMVNGVAQRFDRATNAESWVFSMRGDSVAELYERAGRRLFARNIRAFLGKKTKVNKDMEATLKTKPERFFYYNKVLRSCATEPSGKVRGAVITCMSATRRSSTASRRPGP